MDAVLFYDLGSPYAYLAAERAAAVLERPVRFQPVLLGVLFARRGWGSWALTDRRREGIAEVERRAAHYGLPPVAWPDPWPPDGLAAMRAATWAHGRGHGEDFARAAFRRQFAEGRSIESVEELAALATRVGLPGEEVAGAIADPAVKLRLRELTEQAWEAGVRGVPTVAVDGALFFGDDRLEEAARA